MGSTKTERDPRPSRKAHYIMGKHHPDYHLARHWCRQTAILRNSINFVVRQLWFCQQGRQNQIDQLESETQQWLADQTRKFYPGSYNWLWDLARTTTQCQSYPHQKIAQQTVRELAADWFSYLRALSAVKDGSYTPSGRVRTPGYIPHMAKITFNSQTISRPKLRNGWACPTVYTTGFLLPDSVSPADVKEISVLPRSGHFILEVNYRVVPPKIPAPKNVLEALALGGAAGLDLGINNLAAITSNQPGVAPALVKGEVIKSWNQWANKHSARLTSEIAILSSRRDLSYQYRKRRISALRRERQAVWTNRTRRVDNYLHTASKRIIGWCVANGTKLLVVGKNDGWKQHSKLGRRGNQSFVQIPHSRFIAQLRYKAADAGVLVVVTEESWTSQASFLDRDRLPVWPGRPAVPFSGCRVATKVYRSNDGARIHADVNGAGNVLRKVVSDEVGYSDGIGDTVVYPVALDLPKLLPRSWRAGCGAKVLSHV